MGYAKEVPYIAKLLYLSKWRKSVLHIFDPVFRQNYWVFSSKWKLKEVVEYIRNSEPEVADVDKAAGHFWGLQENGKELKCSMGCIWFTNTPTLVHECVHAMNWMLDNHGLKPEDELQAYYTEWLYRVITKELKIS